MKRGAIVHLLIGSALTIVMTGCSGGMTETGATAMSLFDQLGGTNQIKSLADSFVNGIATDSRTSKLVSAADTGTLKSKMSDQLCALTGGGCAAPLTEAQIAEGAKKIDAPTTSALNENFSKAVSSLSSSPLVKETLTKALGPQVGGIVGALL
jgi:hypothetical protein